MATENQLRANRQNARKSTGPRTVEGKRRSAANSTRHGICAAVGFVLPHEDPEAFAGLHESLLQAHRPVGPLEVHCVGVIRDALWRINRVREAEHAAILFRQLLPDTRKMLNDYLGIPESIRYKDDDLRPLGPIENACLTLWNSLLGELETIEGEVANWSRLQELAPGFCKWIGQMADKANQPREEFILSVTADTTASGYRLMPALIEWGRIWLGRRCAQFDRQVQIEELEELRARINIVPPEAVLLSRYHAEQESRIRGALKQLWELQDRRLTVRTVVRVA